jgi:hypothetical protein
MGLHACTLRRCSAATAGCRCRVAAAAAAVRRPAHASDRIPRTTLRSPATLALLPDFPAQQAALGLRCRSGLRQGQRGSAAGCCRAACVAPWGCWPGCAGVGPPQALHPARLPLHVGHGAVRVPQQLEAAGRLPPACLVARWHLRCVCAQPKRTRQRKLSVKQRCSSGRASAGAEQSCRHSCVCSTRSLVRA